MLMFILLSHVVDLYPRVFAFVESEHVIGQRDIALELFDVIRVYSIVLFINGNFGNQECTLVDEKAYAVIRLAVFWGQVNKG